jgi:cytochrome c oxidase cbb3-type subunit 3
MSAIRSAPSEWRCAIAGALFVGVATLAACKREERRFHTVPAPATTSNAVRQSSTQPAPSTSHTDLRAEQSNAYAISEGRRWFTAFNCTGCHSNGGGGMGPALMDTSWIYGSAPEIVAQSIIEGRPNGMPAFGHRLTMEQASQLTAYVRSLSGLTPTAARTSRYDHMMVKPNEAMWDPRHPKPSFLPRASARQ